jgi:hypothetical protein
MILDFTNPASLASLGRRAPSKAARRPACVQTAAWFAGTVAAPTGPRACRGLWLWSGRTGGDHAANYAARAQAVDTVRRGWAEREWELPQLQHDMARATWEGAMTRVAWADEYNVDGEDSTEHTARRIYSYVPPTIKPQLSPTILLK